MRIDRVKLREVAEARLRALGADGYHDEEFGDDQPDFFAVPGLRKTVDARIGGQVWSGERNGHRVRVWVGSKRFRMATEVRLDAPGPLLDMRARHHEWQAGDVAALGDTPPGPGRVRLRSGPDGIRITRSLRGREFLTPDGASIHWADLALAERLAGSAPTTR
jgi:hypothetical protein